MQQALFWEERARVEAPPMANSLGLGHHRAYHHCLWNGSAEETLYPEILSAERIWCQGFSPKPNAGFRSRGFADGSASGRRPLHRQRAEIVDQLRLGLAIGANSSCAPTRAPLNTKDSRSSLWI